MTRKMVGLVLIAAVSVVMFAVSIKLYMDKERAFLAEYPEEPRPEMLPYTATLYFSAPLGASAALLLVYLVLGLKPAKTESKIAAMLLTMFLTQFISVRSARAVEHSALRQDIAGSPITPNVVTNRTDTVIHVLGVGDEEFDILYPEGLSRYLGWEIYINYAFDRFHDVFGLQLKLTGWLHWDSNDSESRIVALLEEANRETNWKGGLTYRFGYWNDLLLVITCQWVTDYWGWSCAWNRSLIMEGQFMEVPKAQFVMHEITHQFYVDHCESINQCVMCVFPIQ